MWSRGARTREGQPREEAVTAPIGAGQRLRAPRRMHALGGRVEVWYANGAKPAGRSCSNPGAQITIEGSPLGSQRVRQTDRAVYDGPLPNVCIRQFELVKELTISAYFRPCIAAWSYCMLTGVKSAEGPCRKADLACIIRWEIRGDQNMRISSGVLRSMGFLLFYWLQGGLTNPLPVPSTRACHVAGLFTERQLRELVLYTHNPTFGHISLPMDTACRRGPRKFCRRPSHHVGLHILSLQRALRGVHDVRPRP